MPTVVLGRAARYSVLQRANGTFGFDSGCSEIANHGRLLSEC